MCIIFLIFLISPLNSLPYLGVRVKWQSSYHGIDSQLQLNRDTATGSHCVLLLQNHPSKYIKVQKQH